MRNKYEEFNVVIFFLLLTILIEIVFFISLFNLKVSTYKVFSGVINDKNTISILVNEKDLKVLRDNRRLFYNNKYFDYEIDSVNRESIENYILVTIKSKIKSKKSLVNISVFDKKISLMRIFTIIWKE